LECARLLALWDGNAVRGADAPESGGKPPQSMRWREESGA